MQPLPFWQGLAFTVTKISFAKSIEMAYANGNNRSFAGGTLMADYILGIILIGLFIVAARSFFGTRFKGSCCDRCSGCPHAQGCKSLKK